MPLLEPVTMIFFSACIISFYISDSLFYIYISINRKVILPIFIYTSIFFRRKIEKARWIMLQLSAEEDLPTQHSPWRNWENWHIIILRSTACNKSFRPAWTNQAILNAHLFQYYSHYLEYQWSSCENEQAKGGFFEGKSYIYQKKLT
jgi:hypothetical protein